MKVTILVMAFILLSAKPAIAQYTGTYLGPAPKEHAHKSQRKQDSTGGLQRAGGIKATTSFQLTDDIALGVSRNDIKNFIGSDMMGACASMGSSFVTEDHALCQQILTTPHVPNIPSSAN